MKHTIVLFAAAFMAGSPAIAQKSLIVEPAPLGLPKPDKVISKSAEAYAGLKTLSADFEYIVRSNPGAGRARACPVDETEFRPPHL